MNLIRDKAQAVLIGSKLQSLIPKDNQEIFIAAFEMGFRESLAATAKTIIALTEQVNMTEPEKRILLQTAKLIYDQIFDGGSHGKSKETKAETQKEVTASPEA